ncbi:hypothetical protein BUL40_14525 [Croceivirga radicis]|uniref:DUF4369 domain-containing protein n=1 Tax=Croceivirga radicis TaxID=1929488 RepID=A0A1V6LP60_9FLAO|nr:DUF4369 domain-containing protein [Croceivirga radicis]OQD41807.1 hypothetical protein BUL40_14525 [Croceivirga radicis]
MKKIFFTIGLATLLVACGGNSENTMHLTGSIKGLKKGKLYLQKLADTTLATVDSISFNGDGSFEMTYELEDPELFWLHLDRADNNDYNDRLAFFGEAGEITINTTWDEFDKKAKITGSKSHEEYKEYQEMISQFNKKDLEINHLAITDSTKLDSLRTVAQRNYLRRYGYILNYGLTHPNSYVTPYVTLYDGAEANPKYLDSVYNNLSKEVAASKYGKALSEHIKTVKSE